MSRPPWRQLQTPLHLRVYFGALNLISPARAAHAWHFDRMERDPDYRDGVLLAMRGMGYAQTDGPGKAAWPTGGPRSADAEVLQDLEPLRERARITGRIDPVGSGIILNFVQEMVGQGIHDRAATGDATKDAAIDAEWGELQKTLLPAELVEWFVGQLMMAERLCEDGEIWPRAVKGDEFDPLTFELVEGDRVESPSDVLAYLKRGHSIRKGVERDARDRIVAYWIAKSHPGDVAVPGTISTEAPRLALTVQDFDRVTPEQARHVRLPGRPGQSRSVTMLHAVMQPLRDMDLVIEAGVRRIQVAASFAVFIETAAGVTDLVSATAKKYHYQLDQDLIPGMIFILRPGDKATTINPNFPVPDLKVLQEILARRIGAALGISWRVVLSDLGEANFSAARADRIEFEESAAIPRLLLVGGLDWMRRLALEDALLRGSNRLLAAGVTVEDLPKVTWLRRAKDRLDPKAEADGDVAALGGKLVTRRDYHAKRGEDWRAILRQQLDEEVLEREERAARNLPPRVEGAPPALPSASPAAPPPSALPPSVKGKNGTTPREALLRALAEIDATAGQRGQRGEEDDAIATRELKIQVRAIDEQSREIEYIGATETPVDMGDGMPEVLRMAGAEFDESAPFLNCHQRHSVMDVLGRCVTIKREGTGLVFRVRYSKATEVSRAAWELAKDGSIDSVSVGYTVKKYKQLRRGEFDGEGQSRIEGPAVIATSWRVRELSQVPIGADPNARKRAYAGAVQQEQEGMKLKPNPGESREKFTARAMADASVIVEFPDEKKRRAAVDAAWIAARAEEPAADDPEEPAADGEADLEEARRWLTAAIERHGRHMDGSEAADEKSQQALMDEMGKALAAMGAPADMPEKSAPPATPPARSIDEDLAADYAARRKLIETRCPQDLRGFLDNLLLDKPDVSPEDAWQALRAERASRLKPGGTPEPKRPGAPQAGPAPTQPPSQPPTERNDLGRFIREVVS